jgi:peptidoglycan/xylan/chitin deacetylase (PgdA/CDA1 family)
MNIFCIVSLLALECFVLGTVFAAEPVAGIVSEETSASKSHTLEEETLAIRKHHLSRLDERQRTEALVLRQTCKYESEISTAPPGKRVVLSFDDGPDPVQTEYILEILKKHDISGAFFLIGEKAKSHPALVAKIRESGRHTIGNHSWDHPNFHDISTSQQADEVLKYEESPSAGPVKLLFRYPYGNSTCDTNELLHTRGYRIVGWHIDSCDWAFDKSGSVDAKEALSCGVLAQNKNNYIEHVVSTVRAHNGGIVLMHEIHPNTIKMLEEIIVRLKQEGVTFGSIEDTDFVSSLR